MGIGNLAYPQINKYDYINNHINNNNIISNKYRINSNK